MRLDEHLRRRGNHHRPVRERVRGDGIQHERVHAGMDNRAAGREVVGGRPRRRRDDDAVGVEPGDEFAADADGELHHPGQRPARHRHVVQHEVLGSRLAGAFDDRSQHQARLDRRRAGQRGLERRVQLVVGDLRHEPEAAEVHAEDRDLQSGLGRPVGHAEQRAVAPEQQDEIDVPGQVVARDPAEARGCREVGGVVVEDGLDAALPQPGRDGGQVRADGGQPRLGDDADALDHGDLPDVLRHST